MDPQIRFCTSGDRTRIAYASLGAGAPLMLLLGWGTSFEAEWKDPEGRAWTEELARGRQLIRCERRGSGARDQSSPDLSIDAQVADLTALADHLRLECFDLFGAYDGAGVAAAYAARHPDRLHRLILWAPFARGSDLSSPDLHNSLAELWIKNWKLARRSWAGLVFPGEPQARAQWYNELIRESFTPQTAAAYSDFIRDLDITDLLPQVQTPTLVLARNHDRLVPASASKIVASLLPDGTFTPIVGDEGYPPFGDRTYLARLTSFLDQDRAEPPTGLASGTSVIMFTDIVDSASLTERLGDAAFRAASRALEERVRAAIRDAGGTPVEGQVLGDGVMGVFPSAAQAITAARATVAAAAATQLRLHVGLHAGDVIGEGANVYGGAVNIASRVCGLCQPGEILVSQTVRDLARTSASVAFGDRGEHVLKGIADPVRVFAVRAS